jgi:ribonucleotide monophosphatase NagD (HAD superfamily)
MNDLIKKLAEKNERLTQLNKILIPQVAKFLNEERENNEGENTIGCYRAHYILSKTTFDEYKDEEILTRLAVKELKGEIRLAKFKDLQEENPSRIHFIELYLKEKYTYQELLSANIQQLAKGDLYSYLLKMESIDPQEDKKRVAENIRVQIMEIRRKKSW